MNTHRKICKNKTQRFISFSIDVITERGYREKDRYKATRFVLFSVQISAEKYIKSDLTHAKAKKLIV
jgi:hypothetical protein